MEDFCDLNPAMREAFVADGAEVRYLVCEFEEDVLSWRAFRREVIGATDPEAAADGSARAALRASWEELGLDADLGAILLYLDDETAERFELPEWWARRGAKLLKTLGG